VPTNWDMATDHLINKPFFKILGVITLLKIIVSFFIQEPKSFEDLVIAQNIIKHGSFFYFNDGVINHSFQFPIYPILLSSVLAIYNHPVSALILNIILLSSSSIFIYEILKKLKLELNNKKLIILSLIPLAHPAFIYYELKCIHPFTHDFMMLTASIYGCFALIQNDSKNSIEKGLLLGLSILGRGTFIIFPLITLFYLLSKKELKKVALALFGIVIMLTPWLIHNHITDDINSLTSTTGKILWKGSLHDSEGGNYLNNGKNYYSALSAKDLDTLGKMTVKEQNVFFTNKYLEQWKTEPLHVVKMIFVKLKNFWFFSPNMGQEYPHALQKILPIYKFLNLIFIMLLVRLSFKNNSFLHFTAFIIFSVFHCVFYVETRHRLLIDPLIFILFYLMFSNFLKKKTIP